MKEKNYNLELIRTISFIMVIVIHVTNYFCRAYGKISGGEYWFSLILDTVARISVPSFFMISGALLLGREEPVQKHVKRLLRFVTVLLFWSLIYYAHNVWYMGSKCSLLEILYVPTEPHLWYLYAMIPIYVVLPFFQIMCRGMNRSMDRLFLGICGVVIPLMYVMSYFDVELYYDLPLLGDRVYAFYFFLGYFLYKYRDDSRFSNGFFAALFVGSTGANILLTAAVSGWLGDHFERLLEYGSPLVILSGASFFMLMLRAGNGKLRLSENVRKWMDRWNVCSFGIYLIHILFLDNYKKYVEADAGSAYWVIPLLTAGILLVSFGCVWGIRKTAVGRKIT